MPTAMKPCNVKAGETVCVDNVPIKITKGRRGNLLLWVPVSAKITNEMLDLRGPLAVESTADDLDSTESAANRRTA